MGNTNSVLFNLPFSYSERLALEDEIRTPATLEEYLEFAEQAEYKVEYSNGNIIIMGQATDTHELICGNIGWAFNNLFAEDDPFRVYGSNLGIYVPESDAHYKPDASILNAEPEFVLHKVNKLTLKSVVNPFAVVEVFSDGTMDYDMTEKLPNYKLCPFLQHIVYIHQHKPFLTLHTRSEQGWLSTDHRGLDVSFPFADKEIPLKNIYRKVIF